MKTIHEQHMEVDSVSTKTGPTLSHVIRSDVLQPVPLHQTRAF
jgi:hypothetical protein